VCPCEVHARVYFNPVFSRPRSRLNSFPILSTSLLLHLSRTSGAVHSDIFIRCVCTAVSVIRGLFHSPPLSLSLSLSRAHEFIVLRNRTQRFNQIMQFCALPPLLRCNVNSPVRDFMQTHRLRASVAKQRIHYQDRALAYYNEIISAI